MVQVMRDEVAGGTSGMDVYRIGEVGDKTNEEQTAGVYGADFTAESMVRVGARGLEIKVSFDKELMEVRTSF